MSLSLCMHFLDLILGWIPFQFDMANTAALFSVLFVAFASIFLVVCELAAREQILLLLFWLAFWAGTSAASKALLTVVAGHVVKSPPEHNEEKRHHNRLKFVECMDFLLRQHIPTTLVCWYIFKITNWEWWADTTQILRPWEDSPANWLVNHFYICQFTAWSWGLFHYLFFQVPDKNHLLMTSHHCVTIWLIAVSMLTACERFGILVLYVHCASDIFVSSMKAAHHAGYDMDISGFPLAEGLFASNLFIWAYMRLWTFPTVIIHAGIFHRWLLDSDPRVILQSRLVHFLIPDKHRYIYQYTLIAFMIVLMFMSWFWWLLMVNIAIRLARGQKVGDAAEAELGPEATKHQNKQANGHTPAANGHAKKAE
eukprot:g14958.t1